MYNTRILVKGRYINRSTYVLKREDDSVFQTIREGEPFRIGNQMRDFVPVRVSKKNGNGTILVCKKYADDGGVLESFPLPQGKRGLWALTSGAARNGVFHPYREPCDELERVLRTLHLPKSLIRLCEANEGDDGYVNPDVLVNTSYQIVDRDCGHMVDPYYAAFLTDGAFREEGDYREFNNNPRLHQGEACCVDGWVNYRVEHANYVVEYHVEGCRTRIVNIDSVKLSKNADRKKVAEAIKSLCDGQMGDESPFFC